MLREAAEDLPSDRTLSFVHHWGVSAISLPKIPAATQRALFVVLMPRDEPGRMAECPAVDRLSAPPDAFQYYELVAAGRHVFKKEGVSTQTFFRKNHYLSCQICEIRHPDWHYSQKIRHHRLSKSTGFPSWQTVHHNSAFWRMH